MGRLCVSPGYVYQAARMGSWWGLSEKMDDGEGSDHWYPGDTKGCLWEKFFSAAGECSNTDAQSEWLDAVAPQKKLRSSGTTVPSMQTQLRAIQSSPPGVYNSSFWMPSKSRKLNCSAETSPRQPRDHRNTQPVRIVPFRVQLHTQFMGW